MNRTMQKLLAAWAFVLWAAVAHGQVRLIAPTSRDYYVSTTGSDANPGTKAAPFATLTKARDAIRLIQPIGNPMNVWVRGGTYRLTSALAFTPQDSGTATTPITYRAYPNETPIISGGEVVSGSWITHSGSIKYISLPGHAAFQSLIVGGVAAVRARSPNVGTYYLMQAYSGGDHATHFMANAADLPTIGAGETVEVVHHTRFQWGRSFITTIEAAGDPRQVNVSGGPTGGFDQQTPWGRYWLENSLSFLNQAGEFYWDDTADRLYYWPRPGETLGSTTVEIPILDTLLTTTGTANAITYPHVYATYSVRFKTTAAVNGEDSIVDFNAAGTTGVRLSLLHAAGVMTPYVRVGGSYVYAPSTATLNDGAWHTLTAAVNTTTRELKVYVDGAQVGTTQTITAGLGLGTEPPFIGSAKTSGIYFDGEIADLVVLDKFATLTDAQALHAQSYSTLTALMLVHMPMLDDFDDDTGNLDGVNYEVNIEGTRRAPHLTGTGADFNGTTDYISTHDIVGDPVEYLRFRGLTFTATDWPLLPGGHFMFESGYNPDETATVAFTLSRQIEVNDCTFRNCGCTAVLGDNSEYLTIDGNEIDDNGGSGIVVTGPLLDSQYWLVSQVADDKHSRHTITNNSIHDFGRVSPGAVGVLGIFVSNTTVAHNDIYNGGYTGVRMNGYLNSLTTSARNNIVEHNEIHDVGQQLDDTAAIYFAGRQPGSEVRYNLIYDVAVTALHQAGSEGLWGLYLDQGSSGVSMHHNVVHDCYAALMLHRANQCEIRNNVFADSDAYSTWSLWDALVPYTDGTANIYPTKNRMTNNVWDNPLADWNYMIQWVDAAYITASGGVPRESSHNIYGEDGFLEAIGGASTLRNLAFMQSTYDIELGSVVADPELDANYMPRAGSPAYGVGFQSFDLSGVGPE